MDRTGLIYKRLGEISFYPNKRILLTDITSQQYVGVETLVKNRGGISFSDELPNAENAIEFIEEDILIGNIRPYLKKIWKADRKGGASGDVVNIRILPDWKPLINSTYLFMALSSDKFFEYDNANTHGAKMPRGDKKAISEYLIPIPPYDLQNSIVAELDSINESITLLQQQVKDLDALAQSVFYDMFGDPITNYKGWDIKSLKDVSKEKLSYGSGASAVAFDKKIRYIRITDIDDFGNLKEEKVSPSEYDEKYLLSEGDILFARSGATVGKTYCHKTEYGNCIYAGYLIRLIPNKAIVLPSYVFGFTKTQYYQIFVENSQRAVAQPNINAKQYGDLKICVPPLSLQQSYDQKVASIEETKSNLNAQIADLQTLLAARMQYWFQ